MPRSLPALPCALLALLLASPARAQDETDPTFDPFSVLVRTGDTARKQGRLDDAFIAYGSALKVKDDATVHGRLGLLAASTGGSVVAANALLRALEGNGGVDEKEKKAFAEAFLEVRARVCQLLIRGNVYDAEVRIDGAISGKNIGPSYKIFLEPGKHEAVGRSPTAGETRKAFECPKGDVADVFLEWKLPDLPASVQPADVMAQPSGKTPRYGAKHAFEEEREPIVGGVLGQQKKPWSKGSFGIGPTMIFGVATWSPAFGAMISGSWRPVESVSLNLDARAAWVPSGLGGYPIYAMTAGGLLSACAHWKWLLGCITGHLGAYRIEYSPESFVPKTFVFFRPGLGVRGGARWRVWNALALQLTADALGLPETRVLFGTKTGTIVASEVPGIQVGTSLSAVWEF